MNLPQTATDFLDVFIGIAKRTDKNGKSVFSSENLPRIHVYAFSTSEDPIGDIVDRSAGIMKCSPSDLRMRPSSTDGVRMAPKSITRLRRRTTQKNHRRISDAMELI